jgi:hypothetical protein
MADLMFYHIERVQYPEEFNMRLDRKEIEIIFDKLKRHYKLPVYLRVEFNNYRIPKYSYGRVKILMPCSSLNLGILSHEIAHAICHNKGYKRGHNKILRRVLKSVINYCRKHNYWRPEIDRRTEVKMPVILSDQDLRIRKIDKRKADLLRYEKKLVKYQKLYTNKIKKARRSIQMLERNLKPVESG